MQQKPSLIGGQETIDRSGSVRLNYSAANLDERNRYKRLLRRYYSTEVARKISLVASPIWALDSNLSPTYPGVDQLP
jgi:hypothetical protein